MSPKWYLISAVTTVLEVWRVWLVQQFFFLFPSNCLVCDAPNNWRFVGWESKKVSKHEEIKSHCEVNPSFHRHKKEEIFSNQINLRIEELKDFIRGGGSHASLGIKVAKEMNETNSSFDRFTPFEEWSEDMSFEEIFLLAIKSFLRFEFGGDGGGEGEANLIFAS